MRCLVIFILFLWSETAGAQPTDPKMHLFDQFDMDATHPSGRLNPDANPATKQFDFMIGRFICQDSLLIKEGTWKVSQATWEATYTLNGFAIEDQYRNDAYAGMSIRYYNPLEKKWAVHFFGMPGHHQGVWYGRVEGDRMVMRQERRKDNGSTLESRLTFYDISEEAFKWQGELVDLSTGSSTVNWKISAQRAD